MSEITGTSEQPEPSGRHEELDFARGLAVLFMVAVHVLQLLTTEQVQSSGVGLVVEFLGGVPAAPVFMVVLGAGLVFSKRTDPRRLVVRGLLIFALGYLLNLLRGALPALLGALVLNEPVYYEWAVLELLSVDILQFAGLTLMFFSLVKKLQIGIWWLVAIGLVLGAGAYVLTPVDVPSIWLGGLTGLIWGSHEVSFFAFLNWIPYPIAGYCLGSALLRVKEKRTFYRYGVVIGATACVVFYVVLEPVLGLDIGFQDEYSYPHHLLHVSALYLSLVLFWLSLLAIMLERIPAAVRRVIGRWSRNVTPIYLIHWVILGWTAILLEGSLGQIGFVVAVLAIGGVSAWLASIWTSRSRGAARS